MKDMAGAVAEITKSSEEPGMIHQNDRPDRLPDKLVGVECGEEGILYELYVVKKGSPKVIDTGNMGVIYLDGSVFYWLRGNPFKD